MDKSERTAFPELNDEDLRRYKRLSDLLRNFEIVAVYHFMNKPPSARKKFVRQREKHVAEGYERLMPKSLDGRINCGPLCPGVRDCGL
ncbi:MAG TPA: hypothetical protein VG778_09925, partial [Blastocatellia bacterium]|nr:hypothetical protein [Blastocatellia bacterium]